MKTRNYANPNKILVQDLNATVNFLGFRTGCRCSVSRVVSAKSRKNAESVWIKELNAKHNFQPKFATSTTVESKLKITSDPTTYLERLKEDADRREAALQAKRDNRGDDEDAELTFQPKLTKCPAYVTRIARGLALTGRSTKKVEAPAKPDFRF